MFVATLMHKNQISIPGNIRTRLGLDTGRLLRAEILYRQARLISAPDRTLRFSVLCLPVRRANTQGYKTAAFEIY